MSQINSHMFREYDIRGVAGEDLNAREAELIGKAFGTFVRRKGLVDVVVARDCRLSSPELSAVAIAGLRSTGCNVIEIGLASYGLFQYALRFVGKGNGLFVSASHNPPEYNGFRLVANSKTTLGKEIRSLVGLITAEDFETGRGAMSQVEVLADYVKFLKSKVHIEKKLKIIVDCGNAMGGLVMPGLLQDFGCEVTGLYCEMDGTFPNHPPDPSAPANLVKLIETIKEQKADFGLAFDGDADRLGVVDETGRVFLGDQLTSIFARQILAKHHGGKIVFEVSCSKALEDVVKSCGGVPIQSKVGNSNIEEIMNQEKALLAGEMSGHIFFADDFYGIDDAIYASLRFVELASKTKKAVSTFLNSYPKYVTSLVYRPSCPDNVKFELIKEIAAEFKQEGLRVSTIDGAKVLFNDGWGIVRAANTAPQLTLRFEGKTPEALERIRKMFFEKLSKHGVKVE